MVSRNGRNPSRTELLYRYSLLCGIGVVSELSVLLMRLGYVYASGGCATDT